MELPNIKFGGIMGNKRGHVKDKQSAETKEATGCCKGNIEAQTLQHPHGRGIYRLDDPLYTFPQQRHPRDMRVPGIEAFLTHLAVEGSLAGSTQNQAFNAILFLYRNVLKKCIEAPSLGL